MKYRKYPVVVTCPNCGKQWEKRGWSKTDRCLECGLTAAAQAMYQMRTRHGPVYDNWLASAGPKGRPRKHDAGK